MTLEWIGVSRHSLMKVSDPLIHTLFPRVARGTVATLWLFVTRAMQGGQKPENQVRGQARMGGCTSERLSDWVLSGPCFELPQKEPQGNGSFLDLCAAQDPALVLC